MSYRSSVMSGSRANLKLRDPKPNSRSCSRPTFTDGRRFDLWVDTPAFRPLVPVLQAST